MLVLAKINTARMLADARKDHSIPLLLLQLMLREFLKQNDAHDILLTTLSKYINPFFFYLIPMYDRHVRETIRNLTY